MDHTDYSGETGYSEDVITYHSAADNWSVPIAEIRLICEYTNSDGPYLDDYFFVFMTDREGGWHQASFYARGRNEALATLSRRIGTPLECELCNSTQYKTRILWPPELIDLELIEVLPAKKQGLRGKLIHWDQCHI